MQYPQNKKMCEVFQKDVDLIRNIWYNLVKETKFIAKALCFCVNIERTICMEGRPMGDEQNTTEVEVEVAVATEAVLDSEAVSQEADSVVATEVAESSKEVFPEECGAAPRDEEDDEAYYYPKIYSDNIFGKCHKAIDKGWEWVKKKLHLPTLTRKQKAAIWDKITTGILIFLMCTPFLILLYILLWFILK